MQVRIVVDRTCLLDSAGFIEKLERSTAPQYRAAMDLQVRTTACANSVFDIVTVSLYLCSRDPGDLESLIR